MRAVLELDLDSTLELIQVNLDPVDARCGAYPLRFIGIDFSLVHWTLLLNPRRQANDISGLINPLSLDCIILKAYPMPSNGNPCVVSARS